MTDVNPTVPPITSSTNLGALTTSTSLPANCLEDLYDFQTYGLGYPWTYETQGCALSTCCPSNRFYTVGWGWFSSYYSPAVCPLQYKSCAPPATGLSTASGETIIFCCPDTYECPATSEDGVRYWACQSLLSTSTPVTVLDGIYDQSVVTTRAFSLVPGLINSYQVAYPIQIRFKQSELTTTGSEVFIGDFTASSSTLPAAATSNMPTATTQAATTAASSSSTVRASSNSVISKETGGLSTGAKAGIGVSAAIGAFLIVGLSVWLCMLRRRQKKLEAQMSQTPHHAEQAKYPSSWEAKGQQELDQTSAPYSSPRAELQARTFGAHQHRRSELP